MALASLYEGQDIRKIEYFLVDLLAAGASVSQLFNKMLRYGLEDVIE